MKKYKICVYAISKNEEKFVDRWFESMKEADDIYVLDTGSTDKTVSLLEKKGVHVTTKIIKPWRFDKARNESLSIVPNDVDICVCTDLDEVFVKGWRQILEKEIDSEVTRYGYTYNWNLDSNNNPIISFYINKIHTRKNYYWTHPVHEVLTYSGTETEKIKVIDSIILNHYPDNEKSRSSYLPLLELSVKEDPLDDRNMHYLGREYMYYGYYDKAIKTLKKHLQLEKSIWKDERCASMRFIARCYREKKDFKNAKKWASKAIGEAPYLRDPYMEKALISYQEENWDDVILNSLNALSKNEKQKTYINETFCNDLFIYDLLSIAFYNQELYNFSYLAIEEALKLSSDNPRLIKNYGIIQEKRK